MLHRLMYLSAIGAALLFFAESVEAGRKGGCGGGRGHHARGGRGCGGGGGGCGGGGCGGYAMGAPGGCGGAPIIYGGPGMGPVKGTKGPGYEEEVTAPAPANLLVTLPADARLFVDDHETKSTSGERLLTTPDLQPGREYSYTLRAEVMRG